jgi:hypothetical protein
MKEGRSMFSDKYQEQVMSAAESTVEIAGQRFARLLHDDGEPCRDCAAAHGEVRIALTAASNVARVAMRSASHACAMTRRDA